MSSSALDIITGAAKLIGVVFKSEALSADEANDGLNTLNDMLDSWSNDNLMTYAYTTETFSLTGAASYTIGTGGNFNAARPINIVDAQIRIATIDYPLEILTPEQYARIPVKSITSSIPEYLVYDNAYPLGTIKLYPVGISGGSLTLQSNKPLTNLAALTTVVDLPPGWKKALKFNLAIDLAPQYGAQVPDAVIKGAKDSKGTIREQASINNAMPYMPSGERYYSIYGGTE